MTSTQLNLDGVSDIFAKHISKALESTISEAYEAKKKKIIAEITDDLERRKAETIAATMIRLSEHISYQDMGRSIRIEIWKEKGEGGEG